MREQLARFLDPREVVVLTRERVQEAVDDAVERGRMTRNDATALVTALFERGRTQTDDLIAQIEDLVTGTPTRIVREVDRARRAAGIGSNFPVSGYDDLTAAQVGERLNDLSPPELRKVRDYERRNANRKSVLQNIERKLGLGPRRLPSWGGCPPPPPPPPARTAPRRGSELELTVDRLAYGGNGVARREDGYVVFVAGAVPGDRVRAVVGKAKRAYAEARAVEILEPSPDRIEPVADHPGAPWQVLPYERQLAVKQEQVDDALTRIGRLEGYELAPIVPALEQWRYRNKLEYSFGEGPDGELVCGFHAPGRFDQILPLTDCKLASERSNAAREQVLAELPPRRASAPGTAARSRASCATSSCARAAAPASCRSASSPRPASSTPTR